MENRPLQHLGIILDGNRRFAKRLMKQPWKGHDWGAKKASEFLKWCREFGIKYVTMYSLSVQNIFNRPEKELNYIFKIIKREAMALLDPKHDVHKYGIRVKAIGRLYLLPKDLQQLIKKVEKATKDYKNYFLNVAVAYGGQEEITDAIKKIAKKISGGMIKPSQINEELIRHSLYTDGTPYPDLVIRTGGEKRLSNFLLWQSAYSELAFVKKMWPEFSKKDFLDVIKDFQGRERRFGH
jgi:tritrans,polycis-undecaprenyl-diphosphate synthase [geranylgeranyl-diphosphate specific]